MAGAVPYLHADKQTYFQCSRRVYDLTEMTRICLVLFEMNNRILGPYLAAIHEILISEM
jgi:hypothetical protein